LNKDSDAIAFLRNKKAKLFRKRNILKEVNIFRKFDPRIFRNKQVKITK